MGNKILAFSNGQTLLNYIQTNKKEKKNMFNSNTQRLRRLKNNAVFIYMWNTHLSTIEAFIVKDHPHMTQALSPLWVLWGCFVV